MLALEVTLLLVKVDFEALLDCRLLAVLVVDQGQVTLLLHAVVDNTLEGKLLVLLVFIYLVPDFLLHLFASLLVTRNHAFNVLGKGLLSVLKFVPLELVVELHLLGLSCVGLKDFRHVLCVLGLLPILLFLQLDVPFLVGLHLLLLVPVSLLEFLHVLLHHHSHSLLVRPFLFLFHALKQLVLVLVLNYFLLDLGFELLNTEFLLKADIFSLFSSVLLDLLNFFLQQLNVLLDLVSFCLLD